MEKPSNFNELYAQLRLRLVPFLAVFFVTIFATYLVLYVIDFIPEPPAEEEVVEETSVAAEESVGGVGVTVVTPTDPLPNTIFLNAFEREVPVLNPESSDYEVLDAALLEGVVRHPDSADFGEPGNILILGHSSHLPNVLNRNFQAFNGLEELSWGDLVTLESSDTAYVYRVDRVFEAKASEVIVPFTPGEARLTLVTCNNFGTKEDRYIVEAVLVRTETL